ncbi:pseudouridine synthase [Sanyastnella coralliicola]|uniref:pseudouridine synthase n=1 Tax=Sanyastnella coralliicola TaxID=3069118 RepID=UPI0027B87F3E|nr:pseudouridine synthase [Longitalea sp. SCSIO 12813]
MNKRGRSDRSRNNTSKPFAKGKQGGKGKPAGKPGGKPGGKLAGKRAPEKKVRKTAAENEPIRLNRYLSNSGICSRREADVLISTGVVTINDEIVTELGTKVYPGDVVKYDGARIRPDKKRYILLNKPKNFEVTVKDALGRRTVMELVKNATKEPIYPIGKLERQTTGLLLFTNDPDIQARLTDPKQGVRTLFHVTLKEKVRQLHLDKIRQGIELEKGFIKVVAADYVGDGENHHEIGIEIYAAKNNVVADLFKHFGYQIQKLDRVMFAGLTKKDLPRGKWRELSKEEVGFLFMSR